MDHTTIINKLTELGYKGFKEAYLHQIEDVNYNTLSFEDRLYQLLDAQDIFLRNKRIVMNHRLSKIKDKQAALDAIDYTPSRKINKKLNKKENKLALCSAISATKLKEIITARGHKIGNIENFPIIVSDEIETIERTKDIVKILNSLNLMEDVNRLKSRKPRTGKSALRGRGKKIGKSILFVVSKSEKLAKACGTIPGIDVKSINELSVLDLAPVEFQLD